MVKASLVLIPLLWLGLGAWAKPAHPTPSSPPIAVPARAARFSPAKPRHIPPRGQSGVSKLSGPGREPKSPSRAPKTPPGLPPCSEPLALNNPIVPPFGEDIHYSLSAQGIALGKVRFHVGPWQDKAGAAGREFRSEFQMDDLISTLVGMRGRAAAVLLDGTNTPTMSMSRYTVRDIEFFEEVYFGQDAKSPRSTRRRNDKSKERRRHFQSPVRDFLTVFYAFRALPAQSRGCTIVYANQRAYTFWLYPQGQGKVATPVGERGADIYRIDYGSERARKHQSLKVWVGQGGARLPYRVEVLGEGAVAEVRAYTSGRPATAKKR